VRNLGERKIPTRRSSGCCHYIRLSSAFYYLLALFLNRAFLSPGMLLTVDLDASMFVNEASSTGPKWVCSFYLQRIWA